MEANTGSRAREERGGLGGAGGRRGFSAPRLPSLIPRGFFFFFFGLQFPGGNDNYLTITGPSHPFLSGAEVSKSCRRWGSGWGRTVRGERGGGRELGEDGGPGFGSLGRLSGAGGVGGTTDGKRLSSENQDVGWGDCLWKEGVRF